MWLEQLLTLLTFCSRVLEKISSFLEQEVKHLPVCRCMRHGAEYISLSSASFPPQGLAVGHVFPLMAHQTANVDHFMGWEVQEDLLQNIHRDCEELKGQRFVKSAFKNWCWDWTAWTNTGTNHYTDMGKELCMALNMVAIGCQGYLNIAGRRGRWLIEATKGQCDFSCWSFTSSCRKMTVCATLGVREDNFGDVEKGKHLDVRHWGLSRLSNSDDTRCFQNYLHLPASWKVAYPTWTSCLRPNRSCELHPSVYISFSYLGTDPKRWTDNHLLWVQQKQSSHAMPLAGAGKYLTGWNPEVRTVDLVS